MLTYADVISNNPSQSAKRYTARLPYAILAPAIGGLALILFFFFLPWFSTADNSQTIGTEAYKGPSNVSAIAIGTSNINYTLNVVSGDGSTPPRLVSDNYSFPLIWAIPVIGLAQIILALLVLKDKVFSKALALSVRLSFAVALVFELIYVWDAFFLSYPKIKAAGGAILTFPALGLWFSLLVTIITAIMALVLIPDLIWCFALARNDSARAVRFGELKTSNARRDLVS